MPRRLSPKSTLDSLRKDAKRRLKAMRDADPASTLRGAQHAVALDYGFPGWAQLKAALEDLALGRLTDQERVDILLRPAWYGDPAAQARILARDPGLAVADLLTAVVFGDLAEVRGRLADDPGAANRKVGPLNWEPLLYLAFSRLPIPAAVENGVAIATALLDAGADPNAAFDDGWGNPFKAITGVVGHGEGNRPAHPQAAALVDLLLARGAEPFDTQTLYDTSIVDDDTTWLGALYAACEARGATDRWRAVAQGLGGRFPAPALDYLLGNAAANGHRRRVRWLVDHGADPNSRHAYSGLRQHTHALVHGLDGMAALLVALGAEPEILAPSQAFQVAALRRDRPALEALVTARPDLRQISGPLSVAAERGLTEVVALLLEIGQSPHLVGEHGWRPLHRAAMNGAIPMARLLIAAGAEIDPRQPSYDSTPLGAALHFGQVEMVDLLVPLSRDVFSLAAANAQDRLTHLLTAEPGLANTRRKDGATPLFHLPDDEDAAVAVARRLLSLGADPKLTNADGATAIHAARGRGLDEAADLMASWP